MYDEPLDGGETPKKTKYKLKKKKTIKKRISVSGKRKFIKKKGKPISMITPSVIVKVKAVSTLSALFSEQYKADGKKIKKMTKSGKIKRKKTKTKKK